MFTENKPVKKHNETHLSNLDSQFVYIDALEESSGNITVSKSQIDTTKQRKISKTGYLASHLHLQIDSQIMLTSNIDTDNRLVNGLFGRVTEFKYLNNAVNVVHVKFNDGSVGLVARRLNVTAQKHH